MFHLFKKVYLDYDEKINMSYDRMICSERFGGIEIGHGVDKYFYGKVLASAKNTQEFGDFLDRLIQCNTALEEHDTSIFIYCDKESYYKLAITWMKVLLPSCTVAAGWKFFKSHVFKESNFVNSRLSGKGRMLKGENDWDFIEAEFKTYWSEISVTKGVRVKYNELLNHAINSLRIEFLLAGYLYDGRYAENVAAAMTPLVRKDLEKFLYEQKEYILVQFQNKNFQNALGVVNGPYDFSNFYDMVNDPSPLVEVMFRENIWGDVGISTASSKGTINFENITDEDIENLRAFSRAATTVWNESEWYTIERGENAKFDFIKMFRDKSVLNVEDLDTIIKYEIEQSTQNSGSFYAIDLRTVNTYFVDFLLQNSENKDALKPYAFDIITA